ncbi:MAG TPA: trigger factor [Gemmataceae bacterium]|jgi:trigger factor|nr:trigger factor [Gemmataceae bacterium]
MAEDTIEAPPEDATTPAEGDAPPADEGKLKQSVEITDVGPCKKHVKITVEREAIDERFEEKFDELLKERTAAVPGFRPGKAPRKYIVRKFKSSVTEDVRREVLMASLQQLAEDSNISPLAPPELAPEDLILPEEGPFIYEFDVEVRPEFDLPEYKGMKLRKPIHKFTDKDIQDEMRRLLEPQGALIAKEGKDVKVEANDIVVGDLVTIDGDKELNKATGISVRVEKRLALTDSVVENFAKQIAGAKVGDTREMDVKLGEKVADQAIKGKTVKGRFTIKEVKVIRLPELTPDLLERYGVKTEGQLEELIATTLDRNLEYQQRQFARQQILQQVAEKVKWDLPRDLLVRQATRTLQRRVIEMRSSGMTEQQIEARLTVLRQNVLQSTAVSLMEHFVLQKIAELEKIEIEDADIDAEISRIAAQQGESFRKVKAQMEREEMIEALATDLLERKALDVVLNNAVYEEFDIKPEEQEGEVATVSAQAVPGEMVEPVESTATTE